MIVCGRRWGKTAAGLLASLKGHGPTRGHFKGAIDGGKIWWVAPTNKISNELWRDLKRATKGAWVYKSEQERRVELPGGGSVTVRSAEDPESLVAVGLDGLVIDEAGKVPRNAWHESLRPALMDRQGWTVFIGTPKGTNWFYEIFEAAGKDATGTWARWQQPSWENKTLPQSEIDDAKRDMVPHKFSQEIEAKFVSMEGAEFEPEWLDDRIWLPNWPEQFEFGAIAIDPSKGKDAKTSDYSAIVFVGLLRGQWYVDANLERRSASKIVADGIAWFAGHKCTAFGVETNQFQELLIDDFRQQVQGKELPPLPIYHIDNRVNKRVRISRLGPYLMRREIVFRDTLSNRLLVDQLREFPVGDHDDGPDALEMAIRLANEVGFGQAVDDGLGDSLI